MNNSKQVHGFVLSRKCGEYKLVPEQMHQVRASLLANTNNLAISV
jgi:hypothetical protein